MVNESVWQELRRELDAQQVTLVAVSKTKPAADIQALYNLGQRHFGENYVQELVDKHAALPQDICWHFIGHLQGNKVKYIAPFVHLVHGVDSLKLLQEINKQAAKNDRVIDVLLQMHIAEEETKFGFDEAELLALAPDIVQNDDLQHIRVCGLMGMASFSNDEQQVRAEFTRLRQTFDRLSAYFTYDYFHILSMGMSGDYGLAIDCGSTMVRIGSMLFGERTKH